MKTCTRCKNDFRVEDFKIINKRTGKRSSMCPDCKRAYDREYWAKSTSYRERQLKRRGDFKQRNRDFVIGYLKDHPCVDCGESDIIVLEFDHQGDKDFNVSSMVGSAYSIDKIKKEIDKCEVVCANCHKRRTAKQFNWYKGRDTQVV